MYTRETGQLQSYKYVTPPEQRQSAILSPFPSFTKHEVLAMRVLIVVVLLVLMATAANAYTIVMRDGRRVEIPNQFTVTNSTLTYEAGNGIQITIQLNTVDVVATERANGEVPGSLLMKAKAPEAAVQRVPQARRAGAERSVTNADLEKYRRTRVESENRRKELGLPSLEERRREVAAIEDRTVEQARNMRAQDEAYRRSRADALRAEIEANDAMIEPWRPRPLELPSSYAVGGFSGFAPDGVGFGITGGHFNRFRQLAPSPFDGFLATPITPFPRFPITRFPTRPFNPVFRGRGRVFVNPRPIPPGRGSHR
jgi:hypothetical protein